METRCSVCGTIHDLLTHRYCKACKARYMREWRKCHKLSVEQRRRANARSYLHTYVKRGKVLKQPCAVCGKPAQAHHPDYSQPLLVVWLCPAHHHELHQKSEPVRAVKVRAHGLVYD